MSWAATAHFDSPVDYVGNNPVYKIEDVRDVRLTFYRLSKLRDHYVHSQMKSILSKRSCNPVLTLSKAVVHRSLRGCHELLSVLMTEKIFEDFKTFIEKRRLVEGVFLTTEALFSKIVGLDVNDTQCCAALVDLRPAPALLTKSITHNESTFDSRVQRYWCWEEQCCFGVDRRISASVLQPPIMILDDVRSSDNIGVILRTTFSLGIRSLVVTPITWAALNCRAARTSMGALMFFAIYLCRDLLSAITHLKESGITVVGTSPRGREVLKSMKGPNWALITGNEEQGSSKEILDACSRVFAIPQHAGDSLSVSVATGICLYELLREDLLQEFNTREGPDLNGFKGDC